MHQSKRLSIFYPALALLLVLLFSGSGQAKLLLTLNSQSGDVEITGDQPHDKSGFSLSSGDVNGDGKDDIIIGAPGYTAELGQKGAPEVYVIYGGDSIPESISLPPEPSAGSTILGLTDDGLFSFSVSCGDINGDDTLDIVIGAPEASPLGRHHSGKAYIIYGNKALPGTIDLNSPGSVKVTTIFGIDENDQCSYSLASGDIVGDEKEDLVIGAPDADSSFGVNAGETYIIPGSNSLPDTIDLASTTVQVTTILGANGGDRSGFSLACGNINATGKEDLIIGAPEADNLKGKAYAIYGNETLPGTINLATQADVTLFGSATSGKAGFSLSSGEINGDSFDDIIIGAPDAIQQSGHTYIILGNNSLPPTIDLGTQADVTISGANSNDRSGFSLCCRNINGDRIEDRDLDDLIIGAPGVNNWKGEVYVLYGRQTWPGSISLDSASVDIEVLGESAWDELGYSVASGNINGDSTDTGVEKYDLLVGAPYADPDAKDDAGKTYAIYGYELPRVVSMNPTLNALNVDSTTDISVTFNVRMDSSTFNNTTFVVQSSQTGLHPGTFEFSDHNKTLTFTPEKSFAPGELVTVTLTEEVKSLLPSISMKTSFLSSFTIQTSCFGSGDFAVDTTIGLTGEPVFVYGGDLDNDGDIDLAVARRYTDQVSILFNEGCSTWVSGPTYGVGDYPQFIYGGDLDRNGYIDLAVSNSWSNNITILLNNGDGTFANGGTYAMESFPLELIGKDFNGDGYIDIAVVNGNSNSLSLLFNLGDSTFVDSTYAVGAYPVSLAGGDLDNDGDIDLAVANQDDNNILILLNNSYGIFIADTAYTTGIKPSFVYASDFTGDGYMDLAVTNIGESTANPGNFRVLSNQGDGTFAICPPYEVGKYPYAISAGDMDNDGDLDLIVANVLSDNFSVFFNQGDGSFVWQKDYGMGGTGFSVCNCDFNCDGDLDLAVGLGFADEVTLMENLPPRPYPISTSPQQNQVDVAKDSDISVTFSLKMSLPSFNDTSSFLVYGSQSGFHTGGFTISGDDQTITFDPDSGFAVGEVVTVILTTGIKSQFPETVSMGQGYAFSFTTRSEGQGVFPVDSSYAVGTNPQSVYGCYLNGDGKIDIAVANYGDNTVSVLLNQGDGVFAGSTYAVGSDPISIGGGDLDRDGFIDLAVANNGSGNLTVLWNKGDGTFTLPGSTLTVGNSPYAVWCGDLDNDGLIDLGVANSGDGDISVLWNGGNRSFTRQDYSVGSNPRSLCGGDFNQDGFVDLAVANYGDNDITLLIGDGARGFTPHQNSPFAVGNTPTSVYPVDLNANGYLDLAVANQQASIEERLSILLSDSGQTFLNQQLYRIPKNPNSVFAADLNGDGNMDVMVPNWFPPENYVTGLFNNGDGTFSEDSTLSSQVNEPSFVYPADYNGDGFVDLAVANSGTNNLTILWNLPPIPRVVSIYPGWNAVGVSDTTAISVTFDVDMKGSTFGDSTFIVHGSQTGLYSGIINYNSGSRTATFSLHPAHKFAVGEIVTVTLTSSIESSTGTKLEKGFVFAFTIETKQGVVSFGAHKTFEVGSNPRYLFGGDFDKDGYEDLAVANGADNNTSLLLNGGDTTFTQRTFTVVGDPYCVYGGDFDCDSYLDLAVANGFHNEVSIHLNNGDTTFTQQNYPAGDYPRSLYANDLTGDGYPDIAVANYNDSTVSILLDNGDGTLFADSTYRVGKDPRAVYGGDCDNDGDIDLCVANSGESSISILRNDGNGTFIADSIYGVGSTPYSIYINDFNGDGFVDLGVVNFGSDNVSILANLGNGIFSLDSTYDVGNGPLSIFGCDLNGDSCLDLVTANRLDNNVSVLEGKGNGKFKSAVFFSVGTSPFSVFGCDLDGDGAIDLATANNGSNNVSVLLHVQVGIEGTETGANLPKAFSLSQNYPNPFNPITRVKYELPVDCRVRLEIYNILGQRVATLVNRAEKAGYKMVSWDAQDLASGIYFYRLKAGDFTAIKKMVLLK